MVRWDDVTVEDSDQNKQLIQVGTSHFIENTSWPKVRHDTHISDPETPIDANGGDCDNVEPSADLPALRSKSPPWEEALCMIPVLTDAFLENLLQRRSMSFVIRSIARILMTSLERRKGVTKQESNKK